MAEGGGLLNRRCPALYLHVSPLLFFRTKGRVRPMDKLYLPFARDLCRVAIKFEGNKIVALEAGKSFDAAEWKKIADEIDNSILVGQPKVGRDYSFSSFRVEGSWRGQRSGLQILPPPPEAPGARFATAENPFILEFPITSAPDELREITNHRRIREHRRLTLLLNVLLTARINCELRRPESFWALVPAEQGGWFKRVIEKLRFWLAKVGWRQSKSGTAESRWLQRLFWGPLDAIITDALSPQAAKKLTEIEPVTYYTNLGNDGKPLRVPSDLDDSICRYLNLSVKHRSKFDRAIFWMDVASRQWTTSVSSSFASLVSAVEALTDRGTIHDVYCEQCDTVQSHDVPGARQKFRSFFDTYASGAALSEQPRDTEAGLLVVDGAALGRPSCDGLPLGQTAQDGLSRLDHVGSGVTACALLQQCCDALQVGVALLQRQLGGRTDDDIELRVGQ